MHIRLDLQTLETSPNPKERVILVARLNEIIGCLDTLERQLFTWKAANRSKRDGFLAQRPAILEHVDGLFHSVPKPVDDDIAEPLAEVNTRWGKVRPEVVALH